MIIHRSFLQYDNYLTSSTPSIILSSISRRKSLSLVSMSSSIKFSSQSLVSTSSSDRVSPLEFIVRSSSSSIISVWCQFGGSKSLELASTWNTRFNSRTRRRISLARSFAALISFPFLDRVFSNSSLNFIFNWRSSWSALTHVSRTSTKPWQPGHGFFTSIVCDSSLSSSNLNAITKIYTTR